MRIKYHYKHSNLRPKILNLQWKMKESNENLFAVDFYSRWNQETYSKGWAIVLILATTFDVNRPIKASDLSSAEKLNCQILVIVHACGNFKTQPVNVWNCDKLSQFDWSFENDWSYEKFWKRSEQKNCQKLRQGNHRWDALVALYVAITNTDDQALSFFSLPIY